MTFTDLDTFNASVQPDNFWYPMFGEDFLRVLQCLCDVALEWGRLFDKWHIDVVMYVMQLLTFCFLSLFEEFQIYDARITNFNAWLCVKAQFFKCPLDNF